jgi:hypothetical protein
MIRVYIAGPYSSPSADPVPLLENIRNGLRAASTLIQQGYAPFCPFVDFLYWIVLRPKERITKSQIQNYSLEWVKQCQAVLLLKGWERSSGAIRELLVAIYEDVPIFTSVRQLRDYFEREKKTSSKKPQTLRS